MFISADHDKHKIIYPNIRILLYRKVYICYKDTVFQPSDFDMLIAVRTAPHHIVQELLRERTEHLIWKNETFETEDLACLRIYCELIPHYLKFNNTATNAAYSFQNAFSRLTIFFLICHHEIILITMKHLRICGKYSDLLKILYPQKLETSTLILLNKSPKNKNSDANTSSECEAD
ncbi:uncharacterized protein OCT59_009430 [Rhizophagus irregularis]|uniref:uncharacterized protein n=1 Tax=Rhizophagus irregularis TaxID=588596 RepID=UPI003321D25B|nr:hypothetical protein OCT59_009430 [Rhizophagus irregularis]